MKSVVSSAVTSTSAPSCVHCGNPVPLLMGTKFCCHGCEAVFEILKTRDLLDFYPIRKQTTRRSHLPTAPEQGHLFNYLDDPAFIRDYADPSGLRMEFYLEGVHCAACVWLTEKIPDFVEGIKSVRLDLSSSVASVRRDEGASFALGASEFLKMGYRPHPVRQDETHPLRKREERLHLIRLAVAGACSGNIMLLAISLYAGVQNKMATTFAWVSLGLFLPVLLFSSQPFFISAWSSLKTRRLSIDVPIALGLAMGTMASLGSLLTGSREIYFDSLSGLVFLLLGSRYLLRRVQGHALASSRLIHFMTPSRVRKWDLPSARYSEVALDSIQTGDLIEVLAGDVIPVDGRVESGASAINTSLLTGESVHVQAFASVQVLAGTQNGTGTLQIRVRNSGNATRLGQILKDVEASLLQRAEISILTDHVGQAFVLATLVFVALGFAIGIHTSFHEGLNRALAVAIVVCPCAFALAVPLALSVAMGKLAQAGILLKGADTLEKLSRIKTIFLDKTGTLTEGRMDVIEWHPNEPGLERILVALERNSRHPIAEAICRHFSTEIRLSELPQVQFVQEIPGHGIRGEIEGRLFEVKALPNFTESSVLLDSDKTKILRTRVGLFRQGDLLATVICADRLRKNSKESLEKLHALDLKTCILSGDSLEVVETVGLQVGLTPDALFAGLNPEQKKSIVSQEPWSMMVGDGANDAPALAAAQVGIAVRGGMDVSLRAADIYLGKYGIEGVPHVIEIGRETMKVIKRNLYFSIFYNLIAIPTALSGHLSPLFAAAWMPASALSVFLLSTFGTFRLRQIWRELSL